MFLKHGWDLMPYDLCMLTFMITFMLGFMIQWQALNMRNEVNVTLSFM
jgi:hypothetical protein